MKMEDNQPSPYLLELKAELEKLDATEFIHAARLIAEETKRVESGDKYKYYSTVELHHERPASNAVKIRVPAKEFPKVNFSGKLLGPKGSTLKQLQQDTGCKLSILGKGSMRDKNKEEELRKEGGKYAHLNEELHVLVECFAETTDAYNRISHALGEIKKFMNPAEEHLPRDRQPMPMQQQQRPGQQQQHQHLGQQPMDDYYNGDNGGGAPPMGRGAGAGRGGAPRGGRGGLLAAPGMSRGGASGQASSGRGMPVQRGVPVQRGAPAQRGAMGAPRGAPSGRGAPPSLRGAPSSAAGRGAAPVMRGLPARSAPTQRGGASMPRGRSMPPVSMASRPAPAPVQQPEYDDYGAGAAYEEPLGAPVYAQETYEDTYARRDPYAEQDTYAEPAPAAARYQAQDDTQFFDYGHGATTTYDDYAEPAPARPAPRPAPRQMAPRGVPVSRAPQRPMGGAPMKAPSAAPPSRGRAMYRSQPY